MENNVADLSFLKTIANNSSAMMKVFISSFISSAHPSVADLEKALETKDWALMKKAAHTYKPQVNYMGITEIIPVLQQLEEDAAAQTNTESFPEKVKLIKEVSLKAIDELELILKTL